VILRLKIFQLKLFIVNEGEYFIFIYIIIPTKKWLLERIIVIIVSLTRLVRTLHFIYRGRGSNPRHPTYPNYYYPFDFNLK
jgi:hypothetical protein